MPASSPPPTSHPPSAPAAPLILLHGWGLGPGVWSGLSQVWTTHPAITVRSLPGYGGSDDPGEGWSTHAAHLAEALPEGSVLCGWSLGALVALQAALLRPRRWRGLVLVGATPCFMQAPGWPHAQPAEVLDGFAQAVAQSPEPALQRFAALVHQGDRQVRALTRASQQQLRALDDDARPSAGTLLRGLSWLRDTDLRARLSALDLPCLLLHGAHDGLVPLAAAQALADALPHAHLSVLPGAAHAPFLSDPAWFVSQVQDFCEQTSPERACAASDGKAPPA